MCAFSSLSPSLRGGDMESPCRSFRILTTENRLISELPARTSSALLGDPHGTAFKEPLIARRLM
jgi:hypothetical protein